MEKENKFWIIVNKEFPTRVSYKHSSLYSAVEEAKRLAKLEKGDEFIVMEAISSYKINYIIEKEFVDPNDVPF